MICEWLLCMAVKDGASLLGPAEFYIGACFLLAKHSWLSSCLISSADAWVCTVVSCIKFITPVIGSRASRVSFQGVRWGDWKARCERASLYPFLVPKVQPSRVVCVKYCTLSLLDGSSHFSFAPELLATHRWRGRTTMWLHAFFFFFCFFLISQKY